MVDCRSLPCGQFEICKKFSTKFACACISGYERINGLCTDIDECQKYPCHINATCNNFDGGYNCSCHAGFQGNGTTCKSEYKRTFEGLYGIPSNPIYQKSKCIKKSLQNKL